jgi:hypothetical protein
VLELLEGLFGSRCACKQACGVNGCEVGCNVGCGGTTTAPKSETAPAKAPQGNEPAPLPSPPTTNKDASVSNHGSIIQASRNIVRN